MDLALEKLRIIKFSQKILKTSQKTLKMDENILKDIHILKLNILGCDYKMNGKNDIHVIESNVRHIQEMKGNFKQIVYKTWPRTCGGIVFKFYKKQTNSENHEIHQDLMIS